MATILEYTVTGQILCKCCPLEAGDTVDINIDTTGLPVTVPDSIRAIVQLVEEVDVSGVEGRKYTLEYDEADLGGDITELTLAQITSVECVGACTLSTEYVDQKVADVLAAYEPANVEVLTSSLNDDGTTSFSVTAKAKDVIEVDPVSSGSVATKVKTVAQDDLGLDFSTGVGDYRFKIELLAYTISDESANNANSLGRYVLTGRNAYGNTLFTEFTQINPTDLFSVTKTGDDINVQLSNNDATYRKELHIEYTVTVSTP